MQSTSIPHTVNLKTLREAIPTRCFKRSLWISLSYVARDVCAIVLLFRVGIWLIGNETYYGLLLQMIYGFIQGLFFTGLWIIAHECGHDAFSGHRTLNAIMGFLLHSALLVPFFSWKYSHSRHHRYVNNMEKDTVFVPRRKGERSSYRLLNLISEYSTEDAPIISFVSLLVHQIFGWPAYVFSNAGAGPKSLAKGDTSKSFYRQTHFDPTSYLFTSSEQWYVLLSTVGVLSTLGILYHITGYLGFYNTFILYGIPYSWMNHWIVAITYLHHTHPEAPRFEHQSWTFQNGALSTVDRDFGFIGRHIFHGIIEYHVVHHLFPHIPFYHAAEATAAISPHLGKRYLRQTTPFLGDLWKTYTSCSYVEEIDKDRVGHLFWNRS